MSFPIKDGEMGLGAGLGRVAEDLQKFMLNKFYVMHNFSTENNPPLLSVGGGGRGDNSCSDKMSPLPPPTLQKSNKSLKLLLCNSRRFGLLEIRMDGETLQWMSKFLGYYF